MSDKKRRNDADNHSSLLLSPTSAPALTCRKFQLPAYESLAEPIKSGLFYRRGLIDSAGLLDHPVCAFHIFFFIS